MRRPSKELPCSLQFLDRVPLPSLRDRHAPVRRDGGEHVLGIRRLGETAGPGQNPGQHTAAPRHVQYDQDRGAEVARQLRRDNAQRFEAPRRCTDDDDVVCIHGLP